MREPTFLILTALCGKPLHGYAIIKQVQQLSGGEVTLRVGTLYGALDRLVDQQLIQVDREEVVDSRLRRYYRITASGTTALRTEAERRRATATAALSALRLAGGQT